MSMLVDYARYHAARQPAAFDDNSERYRRAFCDRVHIQTIVFKTSRNSMWYCISAPA